MMKDGSLKTVKMHKTQKVIQQNNSNDNFDFVLSTTIFQQNMSKLTKFQIICEIDMIHKNGCLMVWPAIFQQTIQYNPSILLLPHLGSRLTYSFKGNHLKFLYKHAVFDQKKSSYQNRPRSQKMESQIQLNDSNQREQMSRLKKIYKKREQIYKQLQHELRVVGQQLGLLGHFYSLPTFRQMRVQRHLNANILKKVLKLKYENLQFQRQVSTLLNKLTKIRITNALMDISIENGQTRLAQSEAKIISILQPGLAAVVRQIAQVNKKKRGKNLYVIQNLQEETCKLQIVGGVSVVQKRNIRNIRVAQETQEAYPQTIYEVKDKNFWLGKKILKDQSSSANNVKRFERELDIIKKLVQSSSERKFYLLDYYYYPWEKSQYYVEWQDHSLVNYLESYRNQLQVEQLLQICIQIVLIVIDLHGSGIVHRDLKPSNFMVDISSGWQYPILKLIDFSDSMIMDERSKQEVVNGSYKVYSTAAYCPLETSTFDKEQYENHGLINDKIDNWSLGIVLFEVLNGYLPINYSSCTTKDIHALWKFQFMNITHHQKQFNLGSVKNVVDLISYQLIKIEQKDRLQLNKALALLILTKSYTQNLKKILVDDRTICCE